MTTSHRPSLLPSAPQNEATGSARGRSARRCALTLAFVLGATPGCGIALGIEDLSGAKQDAPADAAPWSRQFGDHGQNSMFALAVGPGGGLYATGSCGGQTEFGGGPLPGSADGIQRYVVALDAASGDHRWSLGLGGIRPFDSTLRQRLDAAPGGGVVVAGGFEGSVGPNNDLTAAGPTDGFALSLGAGGEVLAAHATGGAGTQWVADVSVGGEGRVALVGGSSDTTSSGVPDDDLLVARIDDAASPATGVDERRFTTDSGEKGVRVAQARDGGIVVAALYDFLDPFGNGTPPGGGGGGGGVVVAKLDASFNLIWETPLQLIDGEVSGLVVDKDDNVVLTGSFTTFLFGREMLFSQGGEDVFVVKLGPGGDELWARSFGDSSSADQDSEDQESLGVAVGPGGDIYVGGVFAGSVRFDRDLQSADGEDGFLVRLSPEGDPRWSQSFGGRAYQEVTDVQIDGAGTVYIAGEFEGSIDLGQGPLTAKANKDVFVARLAPVRP